MEIPNSFLFVATFADGRQIFQNETDISPTDETRNCFYDVLSQTEQPVSFVITNGELTFGVDLRDGHFESNGVPFFQHRPEYQPYKDFKLVYWRTTQVAIDAASDRVARGRVAAYTIGWEVEHNGERIERTLNAYLD